MGDSKHLCCHDEDPHHEQEVPFLPSLDDEVAPSATDSVSSTLSSKSQRTVFQIIIFYNSPNSTKWHYIIVYIL